MRRRTKTIFISGFVGIFLIGVWYVLQQRVQGLQTYVDPQKQFSLQYPRTWEQTKETGGANAMFMTPRSGELDLFRENLSVVVQMIGNNKPSNLAEYSLIAVDQITAVFGDNIKLIENNPLWSLSGRPAHRLVFIGKGPNADYKYLMVWTIGPAKLKAYQVTYAGTVSQFNRYVKDAEAMIESFKIGPYVQ